MPIEFRCTQCAKLLRTGDNTAGKQAKCPACQTIVTVPSGEQAPPRQAAPLQPQTGAGENPFASGYAGQGYAGQGPQPDSGNPYQAPGEYAMQMDYHAVGASGEIRPSEIDFSETFSRTWAAFTDQLGMCVLVAFLCWLMGMVAGFAAQFAGMFVGLAAGDAAVGEAVSFVLRIPANLFSMWLGIGQAIFFLKVSRGQEAPISDIFSGGPYFLRVLGASIMILVGWMVALLLCCLPGGIIALVGASTNADELLMIGAAVAGIGAFVVTIGYVVVLLMLFQFYYLIIDRNMGIMEAFATSREIMAGNKATAFGILLVTIILGMLFVLFTCGIGAFAYMPYVGILYAILYLTATGQPTMSDYRDLQYQQQVQPQPGQYPQQ